MKQRRYDLYEYITFYILVKFLFLLVTIKVSIRQISRPFQTQRITLLKKLFQGVLALQTYVLTNIKDLNLFIRHRCYHLSGFFYI